MLQTLQPPGASCVRRVNWWRFSGSVLRQGLPIGCPIQSARLCGRHPARKMALVPFFSYLQLDTSSRDARTSALPTGLPVSSMATHSLQLRPVFSARTHPPAWGAKPNAAKTYGIKTTPSKIASKSIGLPLSRNA